MRQLFIGLILAAAMGCKPEGQEVTPATLTGTWVEAHARRDTLIFNLSSGGQPVPGFLLVKRGKEINAGGFLTPRLGSGLYAYTIQEKAIQVGSLFSSSTQTTNYTCYLSGGQLKIGNFFELGFNQPATATRTLVRL